MAEKLYTSLYTNQRKINLNEFKIFLYFDTKTHCFASLCCGRIRRTKCCLRTFTSFLTYSKYTLI